MSTDRDRHTGARRERCQQQLVVVVEGQAELVAVLELGLEPQLVLARLEQVRVGQQDVVDAALDAELADRVKRTAVED